jgi:hypothetical protein
MMKRTLSLVFAVLLTSSVWCQTEISVWRADSKVNAGFRERIYIDGREALALANGEAGRVTVSNGDHVIHAVLYTLTTPQLAFTARGDALGFVVTPYTTRNFVIEPASGGLRIAPPPVPDAVPGPAPRSAPSPRPPRRRANPGGIENSLMAATEKVTEKIPPNGRIAIVYVSADDLEEAEFIAGELEFLMIERGFTLIDRSQLDQIRREQNLQMSGEVDDSQAVSIGKFAGASVIITGAITGSGNLRRLRLRAIDTQTAQVLSVASERF